MIHAVFNPFSRSVADNANMNDRLNNPTNAIPELKPVKLTASFWISFAFLSAVFLWIGVLPAIFMLGPSDIPPLEQTQKSSGKIDFKSAGPKKGSYLVVTDRNGKSETFSCRTSAGSGHWCLPYEYRGKEVELWWFTASTFPGNSHKLPIQIVIGSQFRVTRDEVLERVRSRQYSKWLLVLFEIVVLVLLVPLWIAVQRSKNAVNNN